ncbi:hypothetical protein OCH239_13140 [Roseivivax halodurans JCM 10272]|uniref:Secreted protein n=1 Tax=Roseivivax halodurans JCM 10272 TaxID=1449350 RepID=X7EAK3_9RHOB|nr:hypothetical protein [Roseivivax halodurans]ETX13119.1 hypothetical protein OCH239_13140 [Roseivivax halodurans JCM 10272]
MRIIALLAALLALFGTDARAAAWPQERGAWFASLTTQLSWPQDITTWVSTAPTGRFDALYLEYGATEKLTLGLDLGRSVSGGSKTVAFLQYPTLPDASELKAAVQLGIGQIDGRQVVRPGLLLGRGREGGWIAADLLIEQPVTGDPFDVKLDLTWGLNLAKDRKLILQVQTGRAAGDMGFVRLAPSLVVPLRGSLSTEIGGTWGLAGDGSMGLKLGIWARF